MAFKRGFEPVLDGILEKIEKEGHASIHWVILINDVFRSHTGGKSSSQMLNEWTKENNLKFEEMIVTKGRKKETIINFYKKH